MFAEFLARARAMYRSVFHRAALEQQMRDEFQHHLAERTEHWLHRGVPREEAERRARQEFGHRGTHGEQSREALGLESFARLRCSVLDAKLALRLLPKHPILNLAAVFALAVGIPVGLAPSHLSRALEAPLPGDAEGRIRGLRYWDPASSGIAPLLDSDFTFWSETVRSFSAFGAYRTIAYNVASVDGRAMPASGAQVSPSVLAMLGTRPVLGRLLEASDFTPGAPDVVVLGHGLWSARFGRDPAILGRAIPVGGTPHLVVGVMPDGFAFPMREALWLPLRLPAVGGRERLQVQVIGRLADGVAPAEAQAELAARPAPPPPGATASETSERLRWRPEVVPFGLQYLNLPAGGLGSLPEFHFLRALVFALLLVACGNVAMLVFARTATRLQEFAIRMAIGANRERIISQIFLETLLLAVIAAGSGLLALDWAVRHVNLAALGGQEATPYWLSLGLTPSTALSAILLATVSATAAGVIPAVILTGRDIARGVRGGSQFRFGKISAALMIADLAVSVAAIGIAIAVTGHATDLRAEERATGIRASEYLAVEFRLPEGVGPGDHRGDAAVSTRAQRARTQQALVAALEAEPGVRSVTVADALPRMEHRSSPYEVDGAERASDAPIRWTRVVRADAGYLGTLRAPILSGRDFAGTDTVEGARVAIVNRAFAQRALAGQDPIGKRVRFPTRSRADSAGWFVIVGVVGALGVNLLNPDRGEAVYLPVAAGDISPLQVAVQTSVPPASLTLRVRELAAEVDPNLVIGRALPLSELRPSDWYLVMGLVAGLLSLVAVLVALATSGLYAMLSLSVTERTREIGIRAALGATRRHLLVQILRRSVLQISVGAALGFPVAAWAVFDLTSTTTGRGSILVSTSVALGLAAGVVLFVALCSCLVPVRRILAVQASEAMRAGS